MLAKVDASRKVVRRLQSHEEKIATATSKSGHLTRRDLRHPRSARAHREPLEAIDLLPHPQGWRVSLRSVLQIVHLESQLWKLSFRPVRSSRVFEFFQFNDIFNC